MQKRLIPIILLCTAILFSFLVQLFGRIQAAPAFTFADGAHEVYLTFDDGPSTVVTNDVLDTLKREKVKATFFIVGERVFGREQTLKRIAAEGHTLGVHSYSHRYDEIYRSKASFRADVVKCADLIRRVTGVTPTVYRFPGGGNHKSLRPVLTELGYTAIEWNAVCGDEEIPHASAQTLLEQTMSTSKGKESVILLLHDSAYRKQTAKALPTIISYFRKNGFIFRAF